MKPDEFEQKLSRQPLRQVPQEWRAKIISAACGAQASCHPPPDTRRSLLSAINSQLSTLLWPHPIAWAGLAAVWILIFGVNFSMREPSPRVAEKYVPPSPEVMVELKKQQRLFAELMGSAQPVDADRQKQFSPKPRSESGQILVT